ncbi:MAG: WYL domain-containing protein [Lachnospiraceae bacterium]|nr:WYL domain-containing protein [Lachnospiraceae bacterium]
MKTKKKTLIDIYILKILEKYACKEKPMTQAEVQEKLEDYPYEIDVSRNTLASYIRDLRDAGLIKGKRGIYKPGLFDDHELRLLIDGVLFGQHIPKEVAEELIGKLKGMSEQGLKNRIRHVYYLPGINKTENKNLYEMIDKIDEAINTQRQIKVVRCKYYEMKKLMPLEDEYILDPYYLVTEKSRYYLICRMTKNGKSGNKLINLRVDRFMKVDILSNKKALDIRKIPEYKNGTFQLDEYMRQHMYMVSGNTVNVTMKIRKDRIEDFIDWYGKVYRIIQNDPDEITIRFSANDNAVRFWALQYGQFVTVLEPASLVGMLREDTERLMAKYLKK